MATKPKTYQTKLGFFRPGHRGPIDEGGFGRVGR
jgi:hypothetical protein